MPRQSDKGIIREMNSNIFINDIVLSNIFKLCDFEMIPVQSDSLVQQSFRNFIALPQTEVALLWPLDVSVCLPSLCTNNTGRPSVQSRRRVHCLHAEVVTLVFRAPLLWVDCHRRIQGGSACTQRSLGYFCSSHGTTRDLENQSMTVRSTHTNTHYLIWKKYLSKITRRYLHLYY